MTLAGNFLHPFFFAFHLLDVVVRLEELKIVLKAVTRPLGGLALVAVLLFVLLYLCTLFGCQYFRTDFVSLDSSPTASNTSTECDTLATCLLTTFNAAFKNNGTEWCRTTSPSSPCTARCV